MPGFWRVTVVYGLGVILMDALGLVASGITFRSGAAVFYSGCLIIMLLVPALMAGMSFGRHAGRGPVPPEAWRFALWFATIQGVMLGLLLVLAMQDFLAEESDGIIVLGVVLFVYVAFALLISRYFFGVGARQSVRTRVRR
jgi:hypothetical protein